MTRKIVAIYIPIIIINENRILSNVKDIYSNIIPSTSDKIIHNVNINLPQNDVFGRPISYLHKWIFLTTLSSKKIHDLLDKILYDSSITGRTSVQQDKSFNLL